MEPSQLPKAGADNAHSVLTGSLAASSQPFEMELELPTWDFSASPYRLDTFDMDFQASLPGFAATQPSIAHETRELFPANQMLSLSSSSRDTQGNVPLAPYSSDMASSPGTPSSSSNSLTLVRVLGTYPSLLMKGSFSSPILHLSMYSLYSNVVPDMTFLPQTSMAICCGSGINLSEGNRFFRRAIDAARQRLIGSFVSATELICA